MAFEKVGVRAVVEGLGSFQRGMRQINKGIESAGKAAEDTRKKTEGLNKTLRNVGLGMVGAAAAGGAFLLSATKLAARVETLGVVTKRLGENVGKTEEEIRSLEQSIVDQGITLQASRKSIALMIQSQIDLSKGTDLAREAQDAAVIAGVDSSEAFERLVFVITSGNVRMARTLGLQVSFQDAYKKTAEAAGIATTELTQQQKVVARTNAVLEAGSTITGAYSEAMTTGGKKLLSLNRHIEESRRILGEVWLPIFAEAVDLVTNALKAWENMDEANQKAIARTIGMAVAITGLVGAIVFLIPKIAAAKAAFIGLAGSLGITTVALAAATAGITLILAALVLLFQTWQRGRETAKALDEELTSFEDTLLEQSETWEDYRKEAERVNKVLEEQGTLGKLLVGDFAFLTQEQFEAEKQQEALAASATKVDEKMIAYAQSMRDAADPTIQAERAAQRLADAQQHAADVAEDWQFVMDRNAERVQELQGLLDVKITPSVEDFREELGDLNQQLEDLETEKVEKLAELDLESAEDVTKAQERLVDLQGDLELALLKRDEANERASENDKERSESSILAEENRIAAIREGIREQQELIAGSSDANAASVAEFDEEFAEREASIREQIAETKAAFSDQTKQFLFDLATQRFAIGGFTREELKVLNKLAGPEGLGLIDEAGLALLNRVDEVAEGMELSGDQSEEAADDLVDFAGALVDAAESGEDLIDVINRMPSRVEVEVAMRTVELPARRLRPAGTTVTIPPSDITAIASSILGSGVSQNQFGGKIQRGQPSIVGERGRELFIPGQTGMVMPNRFVNSMTSLFRAAAPIAGAAAAGGGTSNVSNTEMNLNIETASDPEPIIQDFEMMRALSDRRR